MREDWFEFYSVFFFFFDRSLFLIFFWLGVLPSKEGLHGQHGRKKESMPLKMDSRALLAPSRFTSVPQFPPLQHGLMHRALCQEGLKRVVFNASDYISLVESRCLENISLLWKTWERRQSLLWKGMRGASTEEPMRKLRFLSLTQPQALLEPRVIHFIWKHGRMSQGTWDLLYCEFALWFLHKPWLNFGYISNTKAGFREKFLWVLYSTFSEFYSTWCKDGMELRQACLLIKETWDVYVLLKNE